MNLTFDVVVVVLFLVVVVLGLFPPQTLAVTLLLLHWLRLLTYLGATAFSQIALALAATYGCV